MKLLKLLFFSIITISIVISVTSCSPEGAIKKATDGAVDIDKDGTVEIKDKDGKGEMTIGEAKWDKSKMHGMDAPKAKLESFISSNEGTSYMFSEMKDKDIDAYIKKIQKAGFTYNYISIDEFNYTGSDKAGLVFSFVYDKNSNSGMVTSSKGEKPTEEEMESGGYIMEGENATWDRSKVGGLPDPGVKITSFSSAENTVSYNFVKLEDPKEYIEKIKESGYTEEPNEIESSDGFVYSGNNTNGDSIYFSASADGCVVIFTKAVVGTE